MGKCGSATLTFRRKPVPWCAALAMPEPSVKARHPALRTASSRLTRSPRARGCQAGSADRARQCSRTDSWQMSATVDMRPRRRDARRNRAFSSIVKYENRRSSEPRLARQSPGRPTPRCTAAAAALIQAPAGRRLAAGANIAARKNHDPTRGIDHRSCFAIQPSRGCA